MRKNIKKFSPGEVVAYSVPFMRSIGDYSVGTANTRFEVLSVTPLGKNRNEYVKLYNINTGETTSALASNLIPASTRPLSGNV